MEQKKTLWIVAASGVFLLVVAGAALLLSFQKTGTSQTYSNPADGWVSSAKVPDSSIFAENNQALNSSSQTAEQAQIQLHRPDLNLRTSLLKTQTSRTKALLQTKIQSMQKM